MGPETLLPGYGILNLCGDDYPGHAPILLSGESSRPELTIRAQLTANRDCGASGRSNKRLLLAPKGSVRSAARLWAWLRRSRIPRR